MASEEDLILNLIEKRTGDALRGGANDLDHVGDKADQAGASFRKFGDDTGFVDKEITRLRGNIRDLTSEINRTGNTTLLKDVKTNRSQLREFENLAKQLKPIGQQGGQEFGKGFLSTLGDLGASLRGSMIPLLIGIGVAASPAISAAVGAAVIGGIGLGGIIGGIALAARDSRVQTAFKPLGAAMMTGLTTDAKAFVGPLLQVAEDIGVAWEARIRPHIAAAFANLAPSLRGLAAGGTGFLEHLASGFERVSEAAGPFLDQFGRDLPELGADMERFMNSVSEVGPEVTRFFHDMNSGLGTTIAGLGKFIQFGAELNDVLPVGGLVASLGRVADATDTNVETNDAWIRSLFGVSGGLMNVSQIMQAYNTQAGVAATATSQIQASMQVMNSQLVANATAAAMAGAKNQELTASFRNAISAANGLITVWDTLHGKTLSADEALLAAKTSVDALGESFKANKGKIEGNSEAALQNRIAMANAGKAAATAAQEYFNATGDIDGARKIMRSQQKAAEDAAIANGGNAKKVHELADEMFKLPKDVKPKVTVTVSGKAALDALAGAINGIHSKTVFVTSVVSSIISGAKAGARAAGGPVLAGVPYMINERARETVTFPAGGQVHPANLSPVRGSGRVDLVINTSGAPLDDLLGELMKRYVYYRGGGDVQKALGTA